MSKSITYVVIALVLATTVQSLALRTERAAEKPDDHRLSEEIRHRLNKAHGILMVFGWLFFIPSAYLFARMLRDSFRDQKPFGLAVWFQVHRTFNMIGVFLITASFLCIMISKDWVWAGPGSSKKFTTQVHTMAGLLSCIIAWIQPLLSIIRCGPDHPRRSLFNWSHRILGIVGFLLAVVAFSIAALKFQKLWKNPVLQIILVLAPLFILVILSVASYVFRRKEPDNEKEVGYPIRLALSFFGIGTLLTVCTVLTIMIAQGYKIQVV